MSTTFAGQIPVDLRAAWRRREHARQFPFKLAGGNCIHQSHTVRWSLAEARKGPQLCVSRRRSKLVWHVTDPARSRVVESDKRPLMSWEALDALVAALVAAHKAGEPMVPQAATLGEVDCHPYT